MGKVGSTASIYISGGGFDVGGPYKIVWSKYALNKDSVECKDEISPSCYVVVKEGEFPRDTKEVTVSFTIPEAAFGTNFVQYMRTWRPENPYGFSFQVTPSINVSPASSVPQDTVTVKGTGFPAKNDDIQVMFDGAQTGMSVRTNDVGTFTGQFTVPETVAGSHQFKAYDENLSFGDEITTNLKIGPTIDLEPQNPEVGSEVTVTGRGFAGKSLVSIKYDSVSVSNSPTTSESGSFTEKFNVPSSSSEAHVVTATDKAGNVATYGMAVEVNPPQTPNPISPLQQRFGWFGSQPVLFTWSEVSDPSGISYILEVDKSLRFFPLEPGMRKTGLTKPNTVMTLPPGTYYWRVKSVDGAGNESDWSLSPYPFQVGFFSGIYLAIGALIFVIIFIFIVRAFFRRVREYYK
jgi:hypothetical protein